MTNNINGIDVSKCEHYKNNGKCRIPHYQQGIKYVSCNCNEWDCAYKQLKRLQEENEKLKANKGRCAFKCLDNTFCDEAKIRIDKLKLDKDCLNASLETARKYRGIAEVDRGKYKQALEEIREIAKFNQFYNPKYFMLRGDIGQVQNIRMTEIYEKINEVLNDRD